MSIEIKPPVPPSPPFGGLGGLVVNVRGSDPRHVGQPLPSSDDPAPLPPVESPRPFKAVR